MERLVIIDGNALIHRAYHALPPLKTKQGKLVNAVYGFTSILLRVMRELQPDYLAATFDLAGPTFRHLDYQDYKATRVKPAQELYDQIPLIKKIVKSLNIPIYQKKGFEADDLIGTIVQKTKGKKIKNIIISGDLDTLQLVSRQTEVQTLKTGIKNIAVYNQAAVKKRYGFQPKQLVDFKALAGDSSDNIPGVIGLGEKTAIKLIKEFGSLKQLYQKLPTSNLSPKLKARLLEYQKEAFLSYHLATIQQKVPLDFDLKKCRWQKYDYQKVTSLLNKLEFDSLIKRLPVLN